MINERLLFHVSSAPMMARLMQARLRRKSQVATLYQLLT